MPGIPGILSGIGRSLPITLPRIPGLPGPKAPPPPDPLSQRTSEVKQMMEGIMKKAANKGGMLRLVVHQAKIVCNQTLPGMTVNQLLVLEPRPLAEGKPIAIVQDVVRDKNIKPWQCKCKLLPSGNDYLPCNYQPAGMWNPGLVTETCDANTSAPAAPKSMSGQMGYNDGLAQAKGGLQNLSSPATQKALEAASKAQNISLDNLKAMSIIESTGNGAVGTNAFGYTGLMQMGRAAAQDVGMSYSSLVGAHNVGNNAMAGAKYWNINASRMNAAIPRDPLHMYLAHQQGAGGLNSLMRTMGSNPAAAMSRNQLNNIPGKLRQALRNPTQKDFYDYWKGKMKGIQDKMTQAGGGGPKQLSVPEVATHKCSIGGTIRIVDPGQVTKKGKLGACLGLK